MGSIAIALVNGKPQFGFPGPFHGPPGPPGPFYGLGPICPDEVCESCAEEGATDIKTILKIDCQEGLEDCSKDAEDCTADVADCLEPLKDCNCIDPSADECTKECLVGPGPCLRENEVAVAKCVNKQSVTIGKCVAEQEVTVGKCLVNKKKKLWPKLTNVWLVVIPVKLRKTRQLWMKNKRNSTIKLLINLFSSTKINIRITTNFLDKHPQNSISLLQKYSWCS